MTRMLSMIAFACTILKDASALQTFVRDIGFESTSMWFGASSPLDDASFQMLKAQQDAGQMWRFLRRVLYAHGATIQSESALNSFVPSCIGWKVPNLRTFDKLLQELSSAKWVKGFSTETTGLPAVRETASTQKINLFVAGVEGSGHHLLQAIADECIDLGGCMVDPELSFSLWDSRDDKTSLKNAWNDARLRELEEPIEVDHQLRLLNAYDRANHPGELTFTGMMAYPSFSNHWVPRVDLYSQVASEAGDKLHILVLVRDPRMVLCSDDGTLGNNADVAVGALNALVEQLTNLDPSTYQCLDYNKLPTIPPSLAQFLGVLLKTNVPVVDLVAKHFQQPQSSCDDIDGDAVALYAKAQEPLYELCRRADDAKSVAPLPSA